MDEDPLVEERRRIAKAVALRLGFDHRQADRPQARRNGALDRTPAHTRRNNRCSIHNSTALATAAKANSTTATVIISSFCTSCIALMIR